jgi:hypothetical protein
MNFHFSKIQDNDQEREEEDKGSPPLDGWDRSQKFILWILQKNLLRNLGIIKTEGELFFLGNAVMERRNESCAEGIKMGRLNALIKG